MDAPKPRGELPTRPNLSATMHARIHAIDLLLRRAGVLRDDAPALVDVLDEEQVPVLARPLDEWRKKDAHDGSKGRHPSVAFEAVKPPTTR